METATAEELPKKTLWNTIRKDVVLMIIAGLLGSVITAFSILIPFYFNTKHDVVEIKQAQESMMESQENMQESFSNFEIEPALTNQKVNGIEKRLDNLESSVNDVDKKTDRILELMINKK